MKPQATRAFVDTLENRLLLARVTGIDVSHFQNSIDWPTVKNAGVQFAYAKSTEGFTFDDPNFTTYAAGAAAAGLPFGAYHFARPDNNTAANEVSHYLNVVTPYLTTGNLVPMLDLESAVPAGSTKASVSQWVNDWCNGVTTATGLRPMIYVLPSFASQWLDASTTQWKRWARDINGQDSQTGAPGSLAPWSTWTMWQYSVSNVPGITGAVDRDVFNGDLAAFQSQLVIGSEVSVSGGGTNISNNQALPVDFGTVNVGAAASRVFTVRNDGTKPLTLSNLVVPSGFTLAEGLVATLAPGASDTFTVNLNTSTVGTKSGTISFTTNDADENPFSFPVTGTVQTASATITGSLFNDVNGNKIRDSGEAGLVGWTAFLDANGNGVLNAGEQTATTNSAGNYQFTGLPAGTYSVAATAQTGYRLTTPNASYSATVTAGQSLAVGSFGFSTTVLIQGYTFKDLDGNGGQTYPTEPDMANIRVYIDANFNGIWDASETSTLSASNGAWSFVLQPGTYRIRVVLPTGRWVLTTPPVGYHQVTATSGQWIWNKMFGMRVV